MEPKGIWTKRLTIVAALAGLLALSSPNTASSIKAFFTPREVPQDVVQPSFGVEVTAENLADLYRKEGCPKHPLTSVRIVSRSPDIILIDEFVTKAEAEYLSNAAFNPRLCLANFRAPLFEASSVINYEKERHQDVDFRDSWTAYLPYPSDPKTDLDIVANCIEERASAFQGYVPLQRLESLQLVKYHDRQHFNEHFDWFDPRDESLTEPGNRQSSFFVYLVTDCVGGSTSFPKVPRPQRREWCEAIKCQDESGEEVTYLDVQPKVGTAIFWYNLDPSGDVDYNTLHAGTPVVNGTKIGMNIWTRQRKFRI